MVREPEDLIRSEVTALRARGIERFGVNLIPRATDPALLEAQVSACIDLSVPVVALFWDVALKLAARLRAAGITVVCQVGSRAEAQALEQAGAQVLIAQGVEAGGHVRGYRPLHELLPEIAAETGLPVLAAGGLVDGADLATVLSLGAQGAVFGTALIATPESFAHSYHKQRLIEAGDGDTVLCDAFHINWPRGEPARLATTARQPVSCHKRSNTRAAPIRRAGLVVASPSATAPTTMALSAKRAPDRNSRSNCPLWRRSSRRPSVAMTCWRTAPSSRRFSTIWR